MRTRILWFACVLVLALGLCRAGAQTVAWTATPLQDEWLTRFNREREGAGVRPLLPSPVLTQVAQQQAEEMARSGRQLEDYPSERVAERLRRVGYSAHDWREELMRSSAAPEG